MLGPQTEIEIRIWCDEVARSRKRCASAATAMDFADVLLAAYRARYGLPQPVAPAPVWYDEPPFPKDGESYPCWISGEDDACAVHWSGYAMSPEWVYYTTEDHSLLPLHNRRVSPITKPQEPTT